MASPGLPRRWSARWALIAFGLYHLTMILNDYPTLGGGGFRDEGLAISWGHVFGQVGVWVARAILGRDGPMTFGLTGDNGDSSEELARLLVGVVIAVVAASIWTWADRKRPGARWVEPALHTVLRYSIALGLASYAAAKVVPFQFPPLDAVAREPRLGELRPMRLMWSFMQYSQVYSAFAGIAELAVVVLVAFRRTATIGALLCIVVMSNVALMNVCFDVPVKLFATSMVVTAAVIVAFDLPRLIAVLLHRPVPPPVPPDPLLRTRAMRVAGWVAKIVLIGGAIASSFAAVWSDDSRVNSTLPEPLQGTWRVSSYVEAGRDLMQTTEPKRWRRFAVGRQQAAIRRDDDTAQYCTPAPGDLSHHLELTCGDKPDQVSATLTWVREGDQLRLDGTFAHAPVTITLRRIGDDALPLSHHTTRWLIDD